MVSLKKTNKIPSKEIKKAESFRIDYINRFKKGEIKL